MVADDSMGFIMWLLVVGCLLLVGLCDLKRINFFYITFQKNKYKMKV